MSLIVPMRLIKAMMEKRFADNCDEFYECRLALRSTEVKIFKLSTTHKIFRVFTSILHMESIELSMIIV